MTHLFRRAFFLALSLALFAMTDSANAENQYQNGGRWNQTAPALFQQYYVPPSCCGGLQAQLYPSPYYTPPYVGHTFIPYQALAPHEFMYKHRRSYYKWHSPGGFTHTKVSWR